MFPFLLIFNAGCKFATMVANLQPSSRPNQDRLPSLAVADLCFAKVGELGRRHGWISAERFSLDGTLIEPWASLKSLRPKDEQQGPGGGGRTSRIFAHTQPSTTRSAGRSCIPRSSGVVCFMGHTDLGRRLQYRDASTFPTSPL